VVARPIITPLVLPFGQQSVPMSRHGSFYMDAASFTTTPSEPVQRVRTRTCTERLNWSSCEDEVIRRMLQQHGHAWSMIASKLPGRTAAGVRNRWFRLLDDSNADKTANCDPAPPPFLGTQSSTSSLDSVLSATESRNDRIKWSKEEDQLIMELVSQKKLNWEEIAQQLPGRSQQAIRNRVYRLSAHASRAGATHGCWTAAEDALILQSVSDFGKKWTLVAQRFPGRTEDSIRNRYKRLCDAALKLQAQPYDSELLEP